ncbi:MAG: glycosyltransferase, partial [Promethearchaeota archaeon]
MAAHAKILPAVCTVGMVTYPIPMRAHIQDMKTYEALCLYVDRFFLIVWSPDHNFYLQHHKRIIGLYVPKMGGVVLKYFIFLIAAIYLGFILHRRYGITLFQASDPLGGGLAGAALKLLGFGRVLVHLQNQTFNLPSTSFSPLKAMLMRLISLVTCSFADLVRCVSKEIMLEATSAGISINKLRIVPGRCDTDLFSKERWTDEARILKEKLELGDKKIIATVGNLIPTKGIQYLLEAIPPLIRRHPSLTWLIIGEGPLKDSLAAKAIEIGVS